jgi:hypothetical protein
MKRAIQKAKAPHHIKKITLACHKCDIIQTVVIEREEQHTMDLACGNCQEPITLSHLNAHPLEECPVCSCTQLHQHKDFNRTLGFGIFITGAVLVPWTYSLSLIAALAVDAAIFPFCPWMQECYNCHAELRGWGKNPELDRFSHETAAEYEYGKKRTWPPQASTEEISKAS